MTISFGLCTTKWRKNTAFAKYANIHLGKIEFAIIKQRKMENLICFCVKLEKVHLEIFQLSPQFCHLRIFQNVLLKMSPIAPRIFL